MINNNDNVYKVNFERNNHDVYKQKNIYSYN